MSEKNNEQKKRKPFIVRFLLSLLIIIAILLLAVTGWLAYCYFDKTSSLDALPRNYTVYVRTDSAWDAVEPLMDLKAADILLSDPNFLQFRQVFMTIRESELRSNPLVSYALSRRIDAGLYDNNNFLAIVDMNLLSGISRLAPVAMKFVKVKGLSYIKNEAENYFKYDISEEAAYYGKIYKNLVIVSSSKELLDTSSTFQNTSSYTENELKFLNEKLDQPFRIAADGKKLLAMLGEENEYIKAITTYLSSEELSSISLGITDSQIDLGLKIPFTIPEEKKDSPVAKILSRDSKVPQLQTKLPEAVQYYTFITAGSLLELKEAAFKIIAISSDMQKKWQNANNVSQMLFKVSADDILFSWTGDEYAILGLEGKSEPVFVIKIADEKQRRYIFDTVLSSVILKSNNSLLLDGIRLPRIEMPSFLLTVLEGFGVNLPKPYYMVKDGFVYFSQSPENLASINAAIKGGTKLNRNVNYQQVSQNQDAYSAVSLYYNLERSVPFFVKGNSLPSKILKLYNIGRTDVSIKGNTLHIVLNSIACENTSIQAIPGFPMNLDKKAVPVLSKAPDEKSHLVFWLEGNNLIKTLNTASLETKAIELENINWVFAASESTNKKNSGIMWAVGKDGTIYLYNSSLDVVNGFPIVTGEKPSACPCNYRDGILFTTEDGLLIYIDQAGKKTELQLDTFNEVKSAPGVSKNNIAVYEKGFTGIIHGLSQLSSEVEATTVELEGIAYGSPCIGEIKHETYTAMLTQSGQLNVWDSKYQMKNNFPVELNDIFYLNVKICNNFFVALSENGVLYKIALDGTVIAEEIPHLSAKTGYITITDYNNDKDDEIFICGDGNIIYGFNKDLEFLNGFPLSGYGVPVFADINGDKKQDCLVLTVDNKLNGWNIK